MFNGYGTAATCGRQSLDWKRLPCAKSRGQASANTMVRTGEKPFSDETETHEINCNFHEFDAKRQNISILKHTKTANFSCYVTQKF